MPSSARWAVWCALVFQIASHTLDALLWGRWQAELCKDPLGTASPYLTKIVCIHWILVVLINACGFTLLAWDIVTIAR